MKNKKIILGLATVSTVIAPLATVISCGFGKEKVVQFPEEITGITFKGANKHGSIDHEITPIIGVVITTDKDASITLTDGETIIATYTLQENYSWDDGTTEPKTLTTNVSGLANKTIAFPSTVEGLTFKGSQGHGSIDHKVTKIDHVEITTNQDGSDTLSDGNEVVVTYKLEEDYYWADGSTGVKTLKVQVSGLSFKVAIPKTVKGLTFKGINGHGFIDHEITPIIGVVITTDKDASITLTDGEAIIATYTLQKNYSWNDGTNDPKTLTTNVSGLANKTIAIPTEVTGLTFTGSQGHGSIKDPVTSIDHVKITTNQDGSNTLSDGDDVVVTYKLEEDYYWADGKNDPKKKTTTVTGLAGKTVIAPTEVKGLTFKGINGHASIDHGATSIAHVTISYSKEKDLSNKDVITVIYTLEKGYYWADGSVVDKTLPVTVKGLKNGNAFTGTWNYSYDRDKFLNLKETDKITANMFAGESNLTGLTITTGIITDQNAIAGSDAKPGARNIVSLTINQPSLTFIPKSAFYDLKLTTLDLTKCTNLTTIKQHAFHCSLLTTLDLTKNINLESIERFSFSDSKLTTLDLTNNSKLTTIGESSFYSSELTTLDLTKCTNLTTIGYNAFLESKLTTLDLTKCTNLTTIGDNAFYSSELTTLDLSGCSKITTIGKDAFFKIVNDTNTTVTLKKKTYNLIKDKLQIIFSRHDKIKFEIIT